MKVRRIQTLVQGRDQSGDEFGEKINDILEKLENECSAEPAMHQFHFTTSSDGRQTVNISYLRPILSNHSKAPQPRATEEG